MAVDLKVWMYLLYLGTSIGLTIWVARALSRNGLIFLADVFDDERLARAVNNLLVVGFYLLNLGYVTVAMRHSGQILSTSQAMEELSIKIGMVLLVLGALHFFNVFALGRYRRGRLRQLTPHPPVPPAGRLPMAVPVPAGAPFLPGHPPAPPGPARQPGPAGQPGPAAQPGPMAGQPGPAGQPPLPPR